MRRLPDPDLPEHVMREIGGQAARYQAVVIGGKTLRRLHRSHAAASTLDHVRMPRTIVVKRLHDGLGLDRHLMPGALPEIANFLRMPHHQAGAAIVPGVVARHRVPAGHCCRDPVEVHGSAQAAVAGAAEFPVPSRSRHPDFDLDLRIGDRPNGRRHAAKCRQRAEGVILLPLRSRRSEPTRSNRLRRRNRCVLQAELCQALTRRGRGGKRTRSQNQSYSESHIEE